MAPKPKVGFYLAPDQISMQSKVRRARHGPRRMTNNGVRAINLDFVLSRDDIWQESVVAHMLFYFEQVNYMQRRVEE